MSHNAATDPDFKYAGSELDLFEKAKNWKAYWSGQIKEFIKGDVLEVGAGIGANTKLFTGFKFDRWTCLEPDAALVARMEALPDRRHVSVVGTMDDLPADARFDAILYIDVLEHIEDDRAELVRASQRLNPGGSVIVLSPAHQFLFTPFDAAIGHFRRYSRQSLGSISPTTLRRRKLVYLDAAGMLASAGNRLLLRSAMPTEGQILTWDRLLVPVSRIIDPVFGFRVGKSVLGVWQRDAQREG
jgi:SAM-dependent methyltransferase